MSHPRPIREIREELETLHGTGDPEAEHGRADQLLIEAIRRLALRASDTVRMADVDRLIGAWEEQSRGWWWA